MYCSMKGGQMVICTLQSRNKITKIVQGQNYHYCFVKYLVAN